MTHEHKTRNILGHHICLGCAKDMKSYEEGRVDERKEIVDWFEGLIDMLEDDNTMCNKECEIEGIIMTLRENAKWIKARGAKL